MDSFGRARDSHLCMHMNVGLSQIIRIALAAVGLTIFLTDAQPAWASEGGMSLPVQAVLDPLQIRSAKLWMRDGQREERCSAAIIAKKLLLTAAHCLVDWKPEHLTILLSSRGEDKWEQGLSVRAERIVLPETLDVAIIRSIANKEPFHSSDLDISDYGLILLEQAVPAPFEVVRLSDDGTTDQMRVLVLTGYGIDQGTGSSGRFHKYTAKAFAPEGLGTERFLRTKMCSGDSGGGLFKLSGQEIALIGVNSRGTGLCGPGTVTWLPSPAGKWAQRQLDSMNGY